MSDKEHDGYDGSKESPTSQPGQQLPVNRERLLKNLEAAILDGRPESAEWACKRVEDAAANDWLDVINNYRKGEAKDTLLHLAAMFLEPDEEVGGDTARLIRMLARQCPGLIMATRAAGYEGQTALHVLVTKGNLSGAQALIEEARAVGTSTMLLGARATGYYFTRTVMEGEFVLHAAALSLQWESVALLLEAGAPLHATNSRGDTVLHALVRLVGRRPDTETKVIDILTRLKEVSAQRLTVAGAKRSANRLSVWYIENNNGYTALKLAAAVGAGGVCAHILALDNVYRFLDAHDGLFHTHLYDITEVDTVANALWVEGKDNEVDADTYHKSDSNDDFYSNMGASPMKEYSGFKSSNSKSRVAPLNTLGERIWDRKLKTSRNNSTSSCSCVSRMCCFCLAPKSPEGVNKPDSQSVLEMICGAKAEQAFCLLSTDVVRQVVSAKWRRLRPIYFIWLMLHLLFIAGLICYAVYRIQDKRVSTGNMTNPLGNGILNVSNSSSWQHERFVLSDAKRGLVEAWPWINIVVAIIYLALEFMRTACMSQNWHIRRVHHNGIYRLLLVLFSLCLLADATWHWVDDEAESVNNIFLILALLMGAWFLTFFLRAWRKFSFYTILFQKVLVGDMLRFSAMILLELLAFSAAMYIAYLPANLLPEDFEDFPTSMLTMFRVMLGLTDVEVLYDAPSPWLAIMLYIMFVLLTYVLLLNSLIAMMSQTCSLVAEDRELQWRMQRLSVLLLLETFLPLQCRPQIGQHKISRRHSLLTGLDEHESRSFVPVSTSARGSYSHGRAILRRNNLVQTMGFGDSTLSNPNIQTSPFTGYGTISTQGQLGWPQHQLMQRADGYGVNLNDLNNTLNKTIIKKVDNKDVVDENQREKEHPASGIKIKGNSVQDKGNILPQAAARKRHNSERRNQRTQTEVDEPLSRSYPNAMLREQAPALCYVGNDSTQPVLHYLAVPDGSVLSHNNLHGLNAGLRQPWSSRQQSSIGFVSYVNDAPRQGQQNVIRPVISVSNPATQQHGESHVEVPLHPPFSQQTPTIAKQNTASPRVQFVDVNDLSTEA